MCQGEQSRAERGKILDFLEFTLYSEQRDNNQPSKQKFLVHEKYSIVGKAGKDEKCLAEGVGELPEIKWQGWPHSGVTSDLRVRY